MKTSLIVLSLALVVLLLGVFTINAPAANAPPSDDTIALLKPAMGVGLEPAPTRTPLPHDLPGERVPEGAQARSE